MAETGAFIDEPLLGDLLMEVARLLSDMDWDWAATVVAPWPSLTAEREKRDGVLCQPGMHAPARPEYAQH